jgi:hypothetical protein
VFGYNCSSIWLKREHHLVKVTVRTFRIWDSVSYETYEMVVLAFLRVEGRQSVRNNYTWLCSLSALSVVWIYFTTEYASLFQTYSMWYWFNLYLASKLYTGVSSRFLTNWQSFKRILHVILYPNLNSARLVLPFSSSPSFLFQFTLYFRLLFIFFHILFPFKFHYVYSGGLYTAWRLVTCDSLSEFGITARIALYLDWTKEIEGK